jgi:hypothetical protein
LFHTLSDDPTDLRPIFGNSPAATFRAGDALSAFASILDGKHYLPPGEYDERVIGLGWASSDLDTSLAEQLFDLIIANPQQWRVCQKELASFCPRMANVNPEFVPDNWFNDRIATDESLNDSMEAMLIFMGRLCPSTGTSEMNGCEGMCIGYATA